MKKSDRNLEKTKASLRYKTSKKRCNLYVKHFPDQYTEEDLQKMFGQYGDIESIKLFKKEQGHPYAFVCFKQPDSAANAKNALHKSTV